MKKLLLAGVAALSLMSTAHAQINPRQLEINACLENGSFKNPNHPCARKFPELAQQTNEAERIYKSIDHTCLAFGDVQHSLNWGNVEVLNQLNEIREWCADPEHMKLAYSRSEKWLAQSRPPDPAHTRCVLDALATMPSDIQLYGGRSRYLLNTCGVQ